jgi:capsular polysaccharide biosynthesis protein
LNLLKRRGFTAVDIGNLPFIEQVSIFREATKTVSVAPGDWGDCFFYGLLQAQDGIYADVRGTPNPTFNGEMWAPFTLSVQRVAEALDAVKAGPSFVRKSDIDYIASPSVPIKTSTRAFQTGAVQRYDHAHMVDPPEDEGVLRILEEPKTISRTMPEIVLDFSETGLEFKPTAEQHIHGSYLVQRQNVLLFGPNHLVTPEGYWSCESRSNKRQFLWYLHAEFYARMYPGPKSEIDYKAPELLLKTSQMAPADVEMIETPLFLATPLEPPIWGRWIATVAPKVAQFRQYGAGRKFFCHIEHDWQRAFLNLLGVDPAAILHHDAGRTYICRDVMTIEYSDTNMTISAWERLNLFEMVAKLKVKAGDQRKIFVSRLSRSKANPGYRVLQNEEALAVMLEALGFAVVEPETLPFEEQITVFAAAEQVVFLGGSAVFNAVFCAPGTSVVTIESSDKYVAHHAELLASLDLRYGVIFGREDASDQAEWHKRWTVDVARTRAALVAFFGGA